MSIWPDLSLDPLFDFAKSHLAITGRSFLWCYTTDVRRAERRYLGIYIPETRSILFNGTPSLVTVFHECVHYWQHEKEGAGFLKAYKHSRAELRAGFIARGAPEDMAEQLAYERCPHEAEAREKSREMERIYRDKIAGLGAHYA